MTDAFTYKNYSIISSLNERSIYLKITDTINFLSYEGNIDLKELRVSISLEDVYKIMTNCFTRENKDYLLDISVNSEVIKLAFNATIGGFLKINFEVLLREKLMSNDGQLTLNFNKLEQQQALAIKTLTDKCANLEASVNQLHQIIDCCQIFMSNIYTPQGHWCDLQNSATVINNISAKEITFQDQGQTIWKNISIFYKLEKLTINNFNASNNITNLAKIINTNLKELVLNHNASHNTFISLEGIQYFPNLEILTITSAPGLKDVVKILSEKKHKIKTLKFQGCTGVNVVELQTYCQVNNIFLAIS
jgi:hypothetical protein